MSAYDPKRTCGKIYAADIPLGAISLDLNNIKISTTYFVPIRAINGGPK